MLPVPIQVGTEKYNSGPSHGPVFEYEVDPGQELPCDGV